jgi:hypothetical protein
MIRGAGTFCRASPNFSVISASSADCCLLFATQIAFPLFWQEPERPDPVDCSTSGTRIADSLGASQDFAEGPIGLAVSG